MKKLLPEVQKKVDEVVTDHEYFDKGKFFINTLYGYDLEDIIDLFVVDDRLWVLHSHSDTPRNYCVSDYLTGLLIPRSRCWSQKESIAKAKEQIERYNHCVDWPAQRVINEKY